MPLASLPMPLAFRYLAALALVGLAVSVTAQPGRSVVWQQTVPGLGSFTLSPDGAQALVVVTTGQTGTGQPLQEVRLYDAATGAFERTVITPASGAGYYGSTSARYAPDGQTFYTVHSASSCSPLGGCGAVLTEAIHWDLDGTELGRFDLGYYPTGIDVRPDGQRVAVGRYQGADGLPGLLVFDGALDLLTPTDAFGSVVAARYDHAGERLALGSEYGGIVFADAETLVPVGQTASPAGDPSSLAFTTDDATLVAGFGSYAKVVRAYDVASGALLWTTDVDLPRPEGESGTAATTLNAVVRPDDAFVATRITTRRYDTSVFANRIKFLRASTGEVTAEYDLGDGPTGPGALAFVPGGGLLHAVGDTLALATFEPVQERTVDLTASITPGTDFAVLGDTVRFTARIVNDGVEPALGTAYETVLHDALTYVGGLAASAGTAEIDGTTIRWTGDVPAGGEVTVAYDLRVSSYGTYEFTAIQGEVDHASLLQPILLSREFSTFRSERIYTSQGAVPIPDAACPAGAESTIEITDAVAIKNLRVGVTAEHPDRGDLQIDLLPPTGDVFPLIGPYATDAENVDVLFEDDGGIAPWAWANGDHDVGGQTYRMGVKPNEVYHPETLFADRFDGTSAAGTWTLRVCDAAAGGAGSLLHWSLLLDDAGPQGSEDEGVSLVVDGPRGLRYLGPPAAGVTVDDLAAQNLVRGVPGYYASMLPNLWTAYDAAADEWTASGGTGEVLELGRAFMWRLYDRVAGHPTISASVELPFTLSTDLEPNTGDVTLTLDTEGTRMAYLANPFGEPLDLTGIFDWPGGSDIVRAVWAYDAVSRGWVFEPESVRPWEGFRVRARVPRPNGRPRTLTIPATAAGASASGATASRTAAQGAAPALSFTLSGTDADGRPLADRALTIAFSDEADAGFDADEDVEKFQVPADRYALVGARVGGQWVGYDVRPFATATVPLAVEARGTGRSFTLSWDASALPAGLPVVLVDLATGAEVDVRTRSHVAFEARPLPAHADVPEGSVADGAQATDRFALRIGSALADAEAEVSEVELSAVVPNPSAGSARVAFAVPEAGAARLTVVDVQGREVAVLTDGLVEAGRHEVRLGGPLAAGVYLVRLEAGGTVRTRQAVIVR